MAHYGLFTKIRQPNGRSKYSRVDGTGAYPKATAVRIFQDRLMYSATFSSEPLELRPIKNAKPSKVPAS